MKHYTNQLNIHISLAVWLATDTYNKSDDPMTISATGLLQPLRAIILSRQNRDLDQIGDISANIASCSGTAYHDNVRRAWSSSKLHDTLLSLNYPETVINRMVINPTSGYEKKDDDILIYVEQRTNKKCGEFTITGEFDFCIEGDVVDQKSTSVYAYIFGSNAEAYTMQGSIYRWLNPTVILGDKVLINYIFTDWSAAKARQDKTYPQTRILSKNYPLMSISDTDVWIKDKLHSVQSLMGASQDNLPMCTKDELWQSDSVWKYYKDPSKKTRSTKNFDNPSDAQLRLAADGNIGEVVEVVGAVKKCAYCNVNQICNQAKDLVSAGLLIL